MKPTLTLITALLLASQASFAESPPAASPLLDVFPPSQAPTFLTTPSEFVVSHQFRSGANRSQWAEGADERTVFHAYLTHKSVAERSWELRIGKGGQLYSIVSSFGEAMPPQSQRAPWVDEVWQMVAINEDLLDWLPSKDGKRDRIRHQANAFIHQSGMYVGRENNYPGPVEENVPAASFYSPMLAGTYRPEQRSYAVMSWGQIPTPSIHRSGVLFATQFRDLGAGVIEVSYLCFNFGDFPLTSMDTPWGGVRTSIFPELVLADTNGQYQFHTPFEGDMKGFHTDLKDTGGWAAATQNAASPQAYALGLVFGRDQHWTEQSAMEKSKPNRFQRTPTLYSAGDSRHGPRDYTVMAVGNRVDVRPGETYFRRVFSIIGTLSDVAEKAKVLAPHTDYHPLAFTEKETPLLPLFAQKMPNGQSVLGLESKGPADTPICFTYARPVKNSKPLFLMQETATGRYAVSTDPYLFCTKVPFKNPYPENDPKHASFENRVQYLTYDGKIRWLGIVGYAMPEGQADTRQHRYAALGSIRELADLLAKGASDGSLLVRTTDEVPLTTQSGKK